MTTTELLWLVSLWVGIVALFSIAISLNRLAAAHEEQAWIENDLDLVIGPDDIEWNRDENL